MSADLSAAEAKLRAGREALRATEGNVLLAVIQAYADVRRDQQALEVRQTNLEALEQQLAETRARLKAGEVTRTDEAQAEAQLALERSLYAQAQAQLMTSRANYAALVGRNPEDLKPEPQFASLPKTVDEAFDAAETESPDLRQARFTEVESRAKVSSARATYGGQITAHAQVGYSGSLTPYDPRNLDRAVSGQITYTRPLFTNGLAKAQIEQALQLNTSDRFNIEAARRGVVQNVANAWNQVTATARSTEAEIEQVKAASVAFNGMRVEYRAGERSTLDVLIAEETLRDAELALLSARHDAVVAKAALLRHMGRLRIEALVEGAPVYEPATHFKSLVHPLEAPWAPLVRKIDKAAKPKARARTRAAKVKVEPAAKAAETAAPTDLNTRPFAETSPLAPITTGVSSVPQSHQP
jgi:outer membrane protein